MLMTILYADDDADDCELLTEALMHIDPSISCILVNDGREALTVLQQSEKLPDTIFLDVNMPVMTGKQCLIEIKNNPRLRQIPVIMYSTSTNAEEKTELRKLGAFDFIHKANSFQDLRRSITTVIRKVATGASH